MRKFNIFQMFLAPFLCCIQLVVMAQEKPRTIICGGLESNSSLVFLSRVDYQNPYDPEILTDTVSNKSFRFELDIDQPQLYRLFSKADTLPLWTTYELPKLLRSPSYYYYNCYGYYQQLAEVFIQPGDSLHIQLKFNKKGRNTSEYSGDRSKENEFLVKHRFKSQNSRGNWAYTFFGTGAYYKDRTPNKVVEKSNKEKMKTQKKIDRQKTFGQSFINYLTNENNASTIQVTSNVLNNIDSLEVRRYFENGKDFQAYKTLFSNIEEFHQPRSFERNLFVYMELITTYKLNLMNKQFRRHYDLSEEKYIAALDILNESLAELYGATIINQMINEDYNKQKTERLILDYEERFPRSEYINSFTRK